VAKGETTIQAAPTTAAPSAGESAAQIAEAKLKYDPQTAASDWAIQQQYVPQQAALYSSLYNQYANQTAKAQQATQQELYPTQSKILESGAADALARLQNPNYMSPQEQAAQDASRAKATSELQESMRNRANMGGTLFGGRSAQQENEGMGNLLNQFSQQDYSNRMQAGQAAQQALTPYMQILYPQIGNQNQNVNSYQYSSAVPSADSIYNAMYQSSQPQQYASQNTDYLSQLLGIGGGLGTAAILASSKRYKENIKLWGKPSTYLDN
jgi:hypothetical protein